MREGQTLVFVIVVREAPLFRGINVRNIKCHRIVWVVGTEIVRYMEGPPLGGTTVLWAVSEITVNDFQL